MKRNDFGTTSGSSAQPQYMWPVSGMFPVKDGTKGAWVSAGFAQSRIAELEAEVAEARERLRLAVKSADLADAEIDTAWNDAIDAAHLAFTLWLDDPDDERDAYQLFQSLKR